MMTLVSLGQAHDGAVAEEAMREQARTELAALAEEHAAQAATLEEKAEILWVRAHRARGAASEAQAAVERSHEELVLATADISE